MENPEQTKFLNWVASLERRHLADLRERDVARALRALSSAYVERRHRGTSQHVHGALDSAGKRAAFSLFYAPLHFMAVSAVVRALGAERPVPSTILDLGCGTGAAGAAWAIAAGGSPAVVGLDRHPWAVAEARWTLRELGITGRARQSDIARLPALAPDGCVVAAYTINELPDESRRRLEDRMIAGTRRGRILILEPLARGVVPWWPATAARVVEAGGRADEWHLPVEPPPIVCRLGLAAGLNHRELRLQTMLL